VGRLRTPPQCDCGEHYDDMRTGLDFATVRRMLWDLPDPNRQGWYRQKRRSAVLGFWRQLKIDMWHMLHGYCSARRAA